MEFKSHLCVRMLEKAIGAEQLLQVLNKQLSLAVTAAQPGSNPKLWPNMVINTLSFKVCIHKHKHRYRHLGPNIVCSYVYPSSTPYSW